MQGIRSITLSSIFLFFFCSPLMAANSVKATPDDGLVVIGVCFLLGILLLLAEIFLIPGVGVTGIGGVALIGYSCYTAFITYGSQTGALVSLAMIVLTVVVGGSGMKILFHSKAGGALIHRGAINGTGCPTEATLDPDIWIGRKGTTCSDLRPAGKARFDEKTFEVKTEGTFISAGTEIEVCRIESNSPVVRPLKV